MARLRREEEQRSYDRMLAQTKEEPFSRHGNQKKSAMIGYVSSEEAARDELTLKEVKNQISVIINVVFSILACAAAIWVVAKHWSTPARLATSMAGGVLVGVAEVVVYTGYLRRLDEAKKSEKKKKEKREIVNTWVVGGADSKSAIPSVEKGKNDEDRVRRRKNVTIKSKS
jgi:hypothetical protein